jgi:polar amino acid transport system substrate-binding protein
VVSVKYCFAVRKEDAELLSRINEGLAILKETGQYQVIYNRWLGVLEDQGIPWLKVLKYGSVPAALFLLILVVTLLWSRTLSRQVAIRTAALEQEIQERKRAAEELRLKQQQLIHALILLNLPMVSDYLADTRTIIEEHFAQHGDFQVAGLPYSKLGPRIGEKLQEAQDSAGKVKRIVEDLKDFARLDSQGFDDTVDLNIIAQTSVRLVENTLRKTTQRFQASYAEDLPRSRGNALRIEQVIINLLLNACQAIRSDTEGIFLSTRFEAGSGEVVLELRDEGIGIDPEHLPHLTDPFFTTKREQGGTGLGLSVSIGIVKEHRGTLDFASAPGQGTTATFRLPAILAGVRP